MSLFSQKTWLVAKWEFMRNFKLKQEIMGYLAMIAIYAVIFGVQIWDQASQKDEIAIGTINVTEQFEFPDDYRITSLQPADDVSQIFATMEDNALDAVLIQTAAEATTKTTASELNSDFSNRPEFTLYALQQSKWQNELEQFLGLSVREQMLNDLNLDNEQFVQLQQPIEFNLVSKAEAEKGADTGVLGLMAAVLSMIAVFTSFGLCLVSVTQEKQQRVTEQLLTCLTHQQWVDGKAVGLCLSCLKSLLTTSLFALLAFVAIAAFTGGQNLLAGTSFTLVLGVLIFCGLGIALWNYIFVGFSATIDDINHSGKTSVMFLPSVPIILVFFLLDEPGGQVATVLSMVPFTAIAFMPMRMASMEVPISQIALSLVTLCLMIYIARMYAFRIFRANITLFGKEPTWGDIWRSMRSKPK